MWSQTCGKMPKIVRKVTLKIIICKIRTFMGYILALTHFVTHLRMFLDVLEFRVENKKKLFRENCFENLVSEINQKKSFCPQNPPKILNVFIVFCFCFF